MSEGAFAALAENLGNDNNNDNENDDYGDDDDDDDYNDDDDDMFAVPATDQTKGPPEEPGDVE